LGRAYLTAVPWVGTAVLVWALTDLILRPPDSSWWALAVLTILTGSFTVKIPGLVARLSVSEPFVFAATLWFGPSVGAVTAALDALIMSLWLMPGLKTLHRLTFNVSVLVISIWSSSHAFFAISGVSVDSPEYTSLAVLVGPLYVFTACCFLLNSGMVAAALAIERRQSGLRIWREQFLWLSLNYFGGASVAALLVVYAKSIDLAVIGAIVPLLAISYLTFRTTLGRLEDANAHLTELNKLHLSTIETLAMAVDAKDQVTHGHIRRVQRYALGLSNLLGITDEKTLKAVEAAALLHDMGKLAIPEYILNKPGKLTPAEFDKMKLHAGLGADILSAIQFPYPVIPIVRHHHENWDGTGYPDKLKGTAIPLGARILSVVDCYDALTSDRPYRPRLSPDEAVGIIMQRRGTMYDPLVVDTFVNRLGELEGSAQDLGPVNPTLIQIAELNSPPQPVDLRNTSTTSLSVKSALRVEDVAPMALGLATLASPAGCAFFVGDRRSTNLVATSVAGAMPNGFLHTSAEIGERVVGWSASTGCVVRNAAIELEFGTQAPFLGAVLCSAFPSRTSNGTAAVLFFVTGAEGLSERDEERMKELTRELVNASSDSVELSPPDQPSPDGTLLTQFLPPDAKTAAACFPLGIVAVKFAQDAHMFEEAVRSAVRATDSLVSLENGTYVLLLLRASESAVRRVVDRLSTECEVRGVRPQFEWTVLNEMTDRAEGQFTAVLQTLGRGFPGLVSTKLH